MKKYVLAVVALMVLSAGAWAADVPAPVPAPPEKPTTVGGGIPNPWRNPWRTAVVERGERG
jgi:opacity protein-like surface antigen